jgi:hypothetical protein
VAFSQASANSSFEIGIVSRGGLEGASDKGKIGTTERPVGGFDILVLAKPYDPSGKISTYLCSQFWSSISLRMTRGNSVFE